MNLPGTCLLALFAAAVGLYLLTSFTFSSARVWLVVHLAFLARLRDRRNHWKEARAQRRLDRQNAKLLAHEQDSEGLEAFDAEAEDEALAAELYASEQAAARFLEPEADRDPRSRPAFLADEGPTPTRRGAFAEMQEARRPVASAWDDETFASAIEREEAIAETPEAAAEVEELPSSGFAPMRPQLVPNSYAGIRTERYFGAGLRRASRCRAQASDDDREVGDRICQRLQAGRRPRCCTALRRRTRCGRRRCGSKRRC